MTDVTIQGLSTVRNGERGSAMVIAVLVTVILTLLGVAFLLMAVKPHTLYLVPFAFLLWAVQQRHWALLAAGGLGLVLANGLALWFNPLVLKQYFYAVSHHPPKDWATPSLGGTLRYLFGVEKVWLQFVPGPGRGLARPALVEKAAGLELAPGAAVFDVRHQF